MRKNLHPNEVRMRVGAVMVGVGILAALASLSPLAAGASIHDVTTGQNGFWLLVSTALATAGGLNMRLRID